MATHDHKHKRPRTSKFVKACQAIGLCFFFGGFGMALYGQAMRTIMGPPRGIPMPNQPSFTYITIFTFGVLAFVLGGVLFLLGCIPHLIRWWRNE